MGKEEKKEVFKVNNENPAPGDYNIKSKIVEGKAFKITPDNKKYAHDIDCDNKIPGAGEYTPNHAIKYSNISCSMKPKPKIDYDNKIPGPGAYTIIDKKSTAPNFSIGKSTQRDVFNETTVSPGPIYQFEKDLGKISVKSYKFSNDEKMKGVRSITPGPGNYDTKPVFGQEGKKSSMGIKTELINSSKYNPGPGTYNLADKNKPNPKGYKIVEGKKQETFAPKDPENPGPGQYTPDKVNNTKLPKWSMGTNNVSTSHHGIIEKSQRGNPGVGDYDVNKSLKNGPKYSMTAKKEPNYDNKIPGPGSYREQAEEKVKDSAPSWRFGSCERKDFLVNKSVAENPPPGNYSQVLKPNSTGFKFSTEAKNKPIKNDLPGPGAYRVPSTIGETQDRYIASKAKFNNEFKYV